MIKKPFAHLLPLLVLFVGLTSTKAQVTTLLDWNAYKGNPYARTVVFNNPLDSAAVITATLYRGKNLPVLPADQQPSTQRQGRSATITLTAAITSNLAEFTWLEIKTNGIVRFAGNLHTSKNTLATSKPGSLTIVTQVYADEPYISLFDQLMLYLF